MSIVYALIACALGLVAFWAARTTHRLRRRVLAWPTALGRVTSREVIRPTDRGRMSAPAFRFAPDVRYAYRVDGMEYVGDKTTLPWSATGSRRRAERALAAIPDETDVRYDPADPTTSCLYPPGRRNVVLYAAGGVLALLLGAIYAAS